MNLRLPRTRETSDKSSLWLKSMRLAQDTKVSKKMESEMDEASSFIKMEAIMMESGKTIRCMDGANFSMKAVSLHMKAIGPTTSFMAMGRFSMTTLFP